MEPLATVTRSRGIQKRPHSMTLCGRKLIFFCYMISGSISMPGLLRWGGVFLLAQIMDTIEQ